MGTTVKDPTWWGKRTVQERGLTILTICTMLVATALAVGLAIMAFTSASITKGDVCVSPGCIHSASSVLDNMDSTIDPCNDFYRFACGNFLKKTIIPDDKLSIHTSYLIWNKQPTQLRSIIEDGMQTENLRSSKLAKILYKACMDEKLIEEQGLEPLHKILEGLGGWPVLMGNNWNESKFDWKESIYTNRKYGYSVDLFIDFHVHVDEKNNSKRLVYLDQPSLGLDQKYLSKGLENEIVRAYYDYMVDLAVILGANREAARQELWRSLNFEMQLANISVPMEERRNASNLYNPMTIRQLQYKHPTITWLEYINTILSPSSSVNEDDVVIIYAPSYISKLEILLQRTPKRVHANYILWRVVESSISYLTKEVRKRQMAYNTVIIGNTEREPRWKECVRITTNGFSKAIGSIYIKNFFNQEAKKKVAEIVAGIKHEFKKTLVMNDWMDDKTKKAALDKAESIVEHIAYPNELLDSKKVEELYDKLQITPGNYLQSSLNLTIHGDDYTFSQLKSPVNRTDWITYRDPMTIDAFYYFNENSIQIPAGILQGAFFDSERPQYMNYGAIGYIIGHEITHGFDDEGRQFDKDGNLVDWWQASTKQRYLEKAQCIIDQYSNYTAQDVNMTLNGINTQGENIADNGGIKQAYYAYDEWERRNGKEPGLPGLNYTSQQMFWISAANSWCIKDRSELRKISITTGVHSPREFRIIGPLSNMLEFAKDFDCPVGSRMNPEKKCSVW